MCELLCVSGKCMAMREGRRVCVQWTIKSGLKVSRTSVELL